jgi:hypothetical protein
MFFRTIIFLCLFSLFSGLYAQRDANYIPGTYSEKYNERGFMGATSQRFDGAEIIGDYDGNLSLKYSMGVELPNNLGGDISLIFNSNVDHRVFIDITGTNGEGQPVNSPQWIIGYKGFALQVLNFETNFFCRDSFGIFSDLTGEEIPLLIPGYHYTNYFNALNQNLSTLPETHDYIQILMADGSKKTLFNKERLLDFSDATFRTGWYIESGFDNTGYAYVEEYDNQNYLREMWYKRIRPVKYMFRNKKGKLIFVQVS